MYETDGYVIFRDVIDQDLIKEVNDHVEWLQERHPDVRPEQLGHIYLRDDPFWVRLVSDDRLLDIASQFVGPDLALFASHYISKPAYSGQPVLWHQDAAFWPLDPMNVVTLWLAVDHSTPENGCVRVIPGTHRSEWPGCATTPTWKACWARRSRSRSTSRPRSTWCWRRAMSRCITRTSSTAATRTRRRTGAAA